MKQLFALVLLSLLISCSDDEKEIDILFEEVERGAVLRNIEKVSKDFVHEDFNSLFTLTIEEQDLEEGGLLDFVRIYVSYEDQNSSNGDNSEPEVVVSDIPKSDFFIGEFGLPRTTVNFSYQEAINALNIDSANILPGDLFKLRLEVFLTDGRSFSNSSGGPAVLSDFCFFKSPYRYEIAVIEPLDEGLFTGVYTFDLLSNSTSLGDASEGVTALTSSDFVNTRIVDFGFAEPLEITFAGSNVYPKIYQSVNGVCQESISHILSGPASDTFGQFEALDDSVFFLDIVVGFEGFDGDTSPERVLKYRFTKQ